jgi:hypothetical protein
MEKRTTLSQLNYKDLLRCVAWASTGDYANESDPELTAVEFDSFGAVPSAYAEVWCLCEARFANGTRYDAVALFRGDADEGPLLCSVWNGDQNVPLILPPAPAPVLARRGPVAFAASFGRLTEDVFPLSISAKVRFAVPPVERGRVFDVSG